MDGFQKKNGNSFQLNVLGDPIQKCSCKKSYKITGYYRDGYCNTGMDDFGQHTICSVMTDEFLIFSKSVGNDLSTPKPEFNFKGLIDGDHWCICLARWKEAYNQGKAPKVILKSTNIVTLHEINLEILKKFSNEF